MQRWQYIAHHRINAALLDGDLDSSFCMGHLILELRNTDIVRGCVYSIYPMGRGVKTGPKVSYRADARGWGRVTIKSKILRTCYVHGPSVKCKGMDCAVQVPLQKSAI